MKWLLVVDRIEGALAILVTDWDGRSYTVPRGRFREGQVYRWTGRKWVRDAAEERRRLNSAREALERMRATDRGGDVEL